MHNNKPVHVIRIAHVDPGLSGIIVSIYWNNMLERRPVWQASVANAIEKVCVWRERINAGHRGYDDDNSAGRKPMLSHITGVQTIKPRVSLQDPKNMKYHWPFPQLLLRRVLHSRPLNAASTSQKTWLRQRDPGTDLLQYGWIENNTSPVISRRDRSHPHWSCVEPAALL